MSIPLFYGNELTTFDFGAGHPFTGERFENYVSLLERARVREICEFLPLTPATEEDLLLVHTPEYLEHVKFLERSGGYLSADTPVSAQVVGVQRLITGSAIQAAKLLLEDDRKSAHTFGGLHHAGKDYGEGFCVYNDVAIVTKAMIERYGLKRILIIDTDAHQGNGTMDIFYSNPNVLFISMHQDPRTLYPGRGFTHEIGINDGKGYTINTPLPPYAGNGQYEHVFDEIVEPVAAEFRPQMIIRNGGSDPYYADELTALGLDLDGLNLVGKRVREIVDDTGAKLIDMMVSGYGDHVIYGWLALFCGIQNINIDYKAASPEEPPHHHNAADESLDRFTEAMIKEVKRELVDYWNCF